MPIIDTAILIAHTQWPSIRKKSCNECRIMSDEISANFFDKYLHMFIVIVLVLGK